MRTDSNIPQLFLRGGVCEKIIIFLYNNHSYDDIYFAKLAREIKSTYNSTCRNLKIMEEKGLIEIKETEQRAKPIKLTALGKKMGEIIIAIHKF